ncbi:MAG TPA: redoxin family protein [Allosphingosinicella sp.]|nr:redoxin family protein [Allosphingosinicella sp.]
MSLRLVIACLPGLMLGLALAGCDRQKAPAPQGEAPAADAKAAAYPTGRLDRSHAGTPAPAAVFEDGQGRPVRLSVFRGRPLLVNFWATWCAPCVVEMPALDALAARETAALQVIAVSQDLDGRQKVTDFFAARNFTRLEPYLDPEMALMTALRLDTLPTTILYDAEGREVWRMVGMVDWQGERAARLIGEAGAGG